ncbi:MAG: CopG family transcriptional regulator [Bryobacterales bacterium]
MRTTLTLDDDVAAQIRRLRESRKTALKELINEALRAGLAVMQSGPKETKRRFQTKPVSLGRCFVNNLDNTAEVLAVVEGESYK